MSLSHNYLDGVIKQVRLYYFALTMSSVTMTVNISIITSSVCSPLSSPTKVVMTNKNTGIKDVGSYIIAVTIWGVSIIKGSI